MKDFEITNKLEELELQYLFNTTLYYDFGRKFQYEVGKYHIGWALRKKWRELPKEEVEEEIENLYGSDEISVGNYYYDYLKEFYEIDAREAYIELGV